MMNTPFHMDDLLSIDRLQKLQDNFSDATGLALVAVNERGEPITKPSGFSSFCLLYRSSEKGRAKCFECDNVGGRKAMQSGEPIIYRCGCGLAEFAVPIEVEGHYLGAMLSGQVKLSEQEAKVFDYILEEDASWRSDEKLVRLHQEIQTIAFKKFKAAAYSLYHLTHYLVEQGYTNIIQAKLHKQTLELLNHAKHRAELEKSLQEAELQALTYQINPHFLFNVLSTIGRLALLENAEKTEAMVYGFSDMMRYILRKNNNKLITIQSEIEHVTNYLSLQQVRMGDKFSFTITIPEKYYNIPCPFMIIQPLIENSFNYAVEPRDNFTRLSIVGFDNGRDVIIEVTDDGDGMTQEMITSALEGNLNNTKRKGLGIFNVSNRLKLNFGDNYGLEIESAGRKGLGTKVRFRCPIVQPIH